MKNLLTIYLLLFCRLSFCQEEPRRFFIQNSILNFISHGGSFSRDDLEEQIKKDLLENKKTFYLSSESLIQDASALNFRAGIASPDLEKNIGLVHYNIELGGARDKNGKHGLSGKISLSASGPENRYGDQTEHQSFIEVTDIEFNSTSEGLYLNSKVFGLGKFIPFEYSGQEFIFIPSIHGIEFSSEDANFSDSNITKSESLNEMRILPIGLSLISNIGEKTQVGVKIRGGITELEIIDDEDGLLRGEKGFFTEERVYIYQDITSLSGLGQKLYSLLEFNDLRYWGKGVDSLLGNASELSRVKLSVGIHF